jgi:hypothetical protein
MKKTLATIMLTLLLATPVFAEKTASVQDVLPVVVVSGKVLQLQNVAAGDKLEILSIVGVKVYEKKLEGSNPSLAIDLPKGYYIVRIGTTVRKISIK